MYGHPLFKNPQFLYNLLRFQRRCTIKTAKIIFGFLALAAAAALLFFLYASYIANDTTTASILIQQVTVAENHVSVIGDTSNSGEGFKGMNYSVTGDRLYLKPRYFLGGSGRMEVTIQQDMTSINAVYLQGNTPEDVKLIWQRGQ